MNKVNAILKNIFYLVGILVAFFLMSLLVEKLFHMYSLIPAMFTLAVFLVSLVTDGYVYGIVASFLSVLLLNYAFTFPYFKFNFSIPENMVSAVIMLAITFISSALTTKIKQSEKMKAESAKEKMRANLLRAVSHDLRSPLTTIYGSSSVVIEKYNELSDEQIIKLVNGVREDAQWLMGMVENLLSVTRIDGGNVKLNMNPTVLEELIDSVLVRFRKRYPSQKVVVDLPEDFISIPMDAVLIEQVIVNILENAVQHAIGMTELELKVFVVGQKAVFEILDDGCGIPKEDLSQVFTGYYEKKNIEAPADFKKNNMGIGLSVCASIIKAHGGSISVENRKTGGCCFRFSLNMEDECDE
ncbi:MAG: DUF4118 domain-containing protein [Lachnospira sp.]|nr:DUF4118 domain-containing protein [Lachnospira sp.]